MTPAAFHTKLRVVWNNPQIGLGDFFQIVILAVAFYFICSMFRGTRSAQMLLGLALLLVGLIALTTVFNFEVLSWLLRTVSVYLVFGLLVIFQPEVRQALAILGRRRRLFGSVAADKATIVDHIGQVAETLARHHFGALIAIEREISLDSYSHSGTPLNAPLVPDLLATIFYPRTPLHDGGVILRGDTILAARCVFPLVIGDAPAGYGTRHRAAMGLSEETDAVVVVVSEERGSIAMAYQGRLFDNLSRQRLCRYLNAVLPEGSAPDTWRRAWERVVAEPDETEPSPEEPRS